MVHSNFGQAVEFLDKIGVFEVLLPFILVFTLVFALLEKTRIFGVEHVAGQAYTRKNLNAMTAFAVAFFTIASSRVVEVVTKVSANMIILLMASICFLLLVGSFHKETAEGFFLTGWWQKAFILIMFIGLAVIFLDAIRTGEKSWLETLFDFIRNFGTNDTVPTIVLLLVMLGIIIYIIQGGNSAKPAENKT